MYRLLLVVVVSMATLGISRVRADEVNLWLDVILHHDCGEDMGGTWELRVEVIDTGDGADGSFGISAVRALIDGIDQTVSFTSGFGAIDPVDPAGDPRPAVITTQGGTIDIIYGQDLSESEGRMVVLGVGLGGWDVLVSGTFPEDTLPEFGNDDLGLVSQALFLDSAMSPFGSAVNADSTNTHETYWVVECFGLGDFDLDGSVGNSDLTLLLDNWGATIPPIPQGWTSDVPTAPGVSNDDLTRLLDNWGNSSLMSVHLAVPEPTSLVIALLTGIAALLSRVSSERVHIIQ